MFTKIFKWLNNKTFERTLCKVMKNHPEIRTVTELAIGADMILKDDIFEAWVYNTTVTLVNLINKHSPNDLTFWAVKLADTLVKDLKEDLLKEYGIEVISNIEIVHVPKSESSINSVLNGV